MSNYTPRDQVHLFDDTFPNFINFPGYLPIHKRVKEVLRNYQPMSIIPLFWDFFSHIPENTNNNKILDSEPIKESSTASAILALTKLIHEGFEEKFYIRTVFRCNQSFRLCLRGFVLDQIVFVIYIKDFPNIFQTTRAILFLYKETLKRS